MSNQKKVGSWKLMVLVCLFIVWGCASNAKTLDRSITGPQLIVNPESIRLGVVKLMGTKIAFVELKPTNIVFEGSGFKPKDSVFVTLIGPNETKVVVAEAPIQPDGTFQAEVSKLTKITEFLKADAGFEIKEKYEEFIIITQPPIPEGVYTAKVTCMSSDLTAETKLTVKGPSTFNSLMDWLGKKKGKIRDKRVK
ncbi:MAG: hypothetical protein COS40_11670 [Deltaproteobacteria bacterium CG03_land_8_20_14_0_80_45_14]|nr:MAG: hypothetical protein COS40_11670 [Deltaproteobacteria bacterium CG03_land_8_20_14_0_80_45_14]